MRNTITGVNYEKEIKLLLDSFSSHKVKTQVKIGSKRNGGKHYVDVLLNDRELLSLKYQEVKGTAEEKIPFEFMKLQHAIDDYDYDRATIVLAGPDSAWKWKEYYLSDEFIETMNKIYPDVRIIENKQFMEEYLIQE